MTGPAAPALRQPGRTSLRVALVFLGAAAVAWTGLEIAVFAGTDGQVVGPDVAYSLLGLLFVAAGLLGWSRRPGARTGALLVAAGFAVLTAALESAPDTVPRVIGSVATELPIGVLLHVVLTYPSGRAADRTTRLLVVAGYATTVVLVAPQYLFGDPAVVPPVLVVAERPDVVAVASAVKSAVGFVVIVTSVGVVARRLLRADRDQRRALAAACGYGAATILFLSVSAIVARLTGVSGLALFQAQMVAVAGFPVVFVAVLWRGAFARSGGVEELGARLGTADGGRPALRDALAATLGDPTVDLLWWTPPGRWVTAAGEPAALPSGPGPRGTVEVTVRDERLAAVVYDAVLIDEPELVHAAGRIVALAVERERLTAELVAGRAALRESRARIVEEGDRERRRLARDLHDGLQSRLVLLALQAGALADRPDAPDAAAQADRLRTATAGAVEDLRGLVHGILPALLLQRGLCAAVEDLLDRVPVATAFDHPDRWPGLPEAVESAAYFTVAEALTNAIKHAGAARLHVRLAHGAGRLGVEVRDDGCGGARVDADGGLRSVTDRVEALGGWLRLDSPPGGGTSVRAELPCGS